jgi:two-component sensor histidine kinase
LWYGVFIWLVKKIGFAAFLMPLFFCFTAQAQPLNSDEVLTVSEALADRNDDGEIDFINQKVTIGGRSSVDNLVLNERFLSIYIQDHQKGIQVFSGELQADINRGDSIIVRGTVQLYYDKPEIIADTIKIIDSGIKTPELIPLQKVAQNPERYLGMLSSGKAVVSQKSASSGYWGLTMTLEDTSEHILEVYVSQSHAFKDQFNLDLFSIGDEIEVTGIVGKFVFQSNGNTVYHIKPRNPQDIKTTGIPRKYLWYVGISVFFIVVFILGWLVVLRKQVKARTKELTTALEEKEILMQEIHHRVKNNLAKISALLDLQISTAEHPAVEESLSNSKSRINSMALVHDKLYQTQHYKTVLLNTYLKELIKSIHDTYTSDLNNVEFDFELEPIRLSVDKVVVCGLLVNELIVNSFKYAFNDDKQGRLSVVLKQKKDRISLSIGDNGPGLPNDFHELVGEGLGSILIQNFADQLDAKLDVKSNSSGTTFTLIFKP